MFPFIVYNYEEKYCKVQLEVFMKYQQLVDLSGAYLIPLKQSFGLESCVIP